METFYLVNDVAKALGISSQTVRMLEREGKIAASRTPSGVRLFRASDVKRLKSERSKKSAAEQGAVEQTDSSLAKPGKPEKFISRDERRKTSSTEV